METSIEVDASRALGEIDPGIYGHFIENMARCIYGGLLKNEKPGHARGPWSMREGLVDEVVFFVAPKLLGMGPGPVADIGISALGEAAKVEIVETRRVGADMMIRCKLGGA